MNVQTNYDVVVVQAFERGYARIVAAPPHRR